MPVVPASSNANPWPREIERYRASIYAFGALATAALLKLVDLLADDQRPLGGVDFLSLLVGVLALVAVYFPANAWAKFVAGVAGAVAQALVGVFTDGRITAAELVMVGVSLLVALGIGTKPNAALAPVIADDTPSA
jgi:hypothetical protein